MKQKQNFREKSIKKGRSLEDKNHGSDSCKIEYSFFKQTKELFVGKVKVNTSDMTGVLDVKIDSPSEKEYDIPIENQDIFLEQSYQSLIENSPDAIFIIDKKACFKQINPMFRKLSGNSDDKIIGESGFKFIRPRMIKDIKKVFSEVLKGKSIKDIRFDVRIKDGNYIPVSVNMFPIRTSDDKIKEFVGIARDLSDISTYEKRLVYSEQRQREIFKSVPDGIIVIDETGIIVDANDEFITMTGYSSKDIIGTKYLKLPTIKKADRIFILNTFRKLLEKGRIKSIEISWIKKDGEERSGVLNSTLIENPTGNKIIIATIKDITKNKKIGENLKKSEKKYRLLFENMISGFAIHEVITDKSKRPVDYRFVDVNPAFKEITGIKNPKGKLVSEIMPGIKDDPADWIGLYGEVSLKGTPIRFTQYSESLKKWFSVSAFSPEKGFFVTIFDDITKLKTAEQAILEKEKKFNAMFDLSPEPAVLSEFGTNTLIDMNQEFVKLLGKAKENLIGKTFEKIGLLLDKKLRAEWMTQIIENGGVFEFEATLNLKDRKREVFLSSIRLNIDDNECILTTIKDMTDFKKLIDDLFENKDKYENIFNIVPHAILSINDKGIIIDCNKKVKTAFGYGKKELLGTDFREILHEDSKQDGTEVLQRIITSTKAIRHKKHVVMKDGKTKHFLVNSAAIRKRDGNFERSLCIFDDITEDVEREKKVNESESKFKGIFESVADGVFLIHDGKIIDCNPAILKMFDMDKDDILHTTPSQLSPETQPDGAVSTDKADIILKKVIRSKRSETFECTHMSKNGNVFPTKVTLSPIIINMEDHILAVVRDVSEEKEKETMLKVSEEKYRTLLTSLNEGIWAIDENNQTSFVNPMLTNMFGYTAEEMIGKTLFDFMDEDEKKSTRMKLKKRREGISERHEFKFIKKDGAELWTLFSTSPIISDTGEYKGAIAGIIDISSRKLAEKRLEESEKKFRMISENSPMLISEVDSKGRFIYINKSHKNIIGYDIEELSGISAVDLIHPENQLDAKKSFKKLITDKDVSASDNIWRFKTKAGDYRTMRVLSKKYLGDNGDIKIITMSIDLTDSLKTEELKRLHSTLVSQTFGAIVVTDTDGIIEYVNPAFEKVTGYSFEEVKGLNPNILNSGRLPKKHYDEMWNTLESGKTWKGEFINKRKDGTTYIEDASITPIKNTKGDITNYVAIKYDITEKKKFQDELQKNEEKLRELVSNMASGVAVYESQDGKEFYLKEINNAGERISKRSRKETIGKEVRVAFPGIVEMGLYDVIKRVWKTGKSENFDISHYKDSIVEIWVKNYIYKLPSGEIVAVYDDITEKKVAEEKLSSHKDFIENLMTCASDLIIALNNKKNITTWNRAMEVVSGYKYWEVINKPLCETINCEDVERIKSEIFSGDKDRVNISIVSKQGIRKNIFFNITHLSDTEGNLTSTILIGSEIPKNHHNKKIIEGTCYYSSENTSESLYPFVDAYLKNGNKGLIIRRPSTTIDSFQITNKNLKIVMMSKHEGIGKTVNSLDEIKEVVSDFCQENKGLILLERMDYLITNFGFQECLKYLYEMIDIIKFKRCNMIIHLNTQILSIQELMLLKEELEEFLYESSSTKALKPEFFEIINLVYSNSLKKITTSYSNVVDRFNITTTTARRRIESLKEMGLISVIKDGRRKILTLTKDGNDIARITK